MNAGGKNRNFKVHVDRSQYHIGQKIFPSLEDLIQHYRTHPIYKNDSEKHFLIRAFRHPGIVAYPGVSPDTIAAPMASAEKSINMTSITSTAVTTISISPVAQTFSDGLVSGAHSSLVGAANGQQSIYLR
ncbi:unnamed protein product [Protopolystoma xenopodis]|uniref:SH2 domain-containing protein n=1 Tax=Protopolystoma xenopodis TaxID=117903 RepID=A0A448XQU4_9PLAT|nr:unnamed protein product [Protopolystoma xenopodis]